MKTLDPITERQVAAVEALLMPLYRCMFCQQGVEVKNITIQEAGRWKRGELIQKVWPWMDDDARQAIISRACPECYWEYIAPVFEVEDEVCEYCGEDCGELIEMVVAPPTWGDHAETYYVSRECGNEWAKGLVR